jgi:hypothetical protein
MHIVVDLIMYALQCNMMIWQIFSLHNTRGVTDVAHTVVVGGATDVDVAPGVAADRVPCLEMNPVLAQRLAKKVLGEDLHAEAEPFYHECFIDMYKVMVPLFFTPPPSLFPVGSCPNCNCVATDR